MMMKAVSVPDSKIDIEPIQSWVSKVSISFYSGRAVHLALAGLRWARRKWVLEAHPLTQASRTVGLQ